MKYTGADHGALERKFDLVTCTDNVDIYHIDGLENKLGFFFSMRLGCFCLGTKSCCQA